MILYNARTNLDTLMHNAFNVVVNNMPIAITAIIENMQYTEARQTV